MGEGRQNRVGRVKRGRPVGRPVQGVGGGWIWLLGWVLTPVPS